MNRDLVRRKLESVVQILNDLDRHLASAQPGEGLNHYIGERLLELLVEYGADINAEVAQGVAGIPPSDYYKSFYSMARTGWISSDVANTLALCVNLRNRLVHRYDEVSLSSLYAELERTRPVWRQYVASIYQHLSTPT